MAQGKTKPIWEISCPMCVTTLNMDAIEIISTNQEAKFIIKPVYICGKCQSACVMELVEVDREPPPPTLPK